MKQQITQYSLHVNKLITCGLGLILVLSLGAIFRLFNSQELLYFGKKIDKHQLMLKPTEGLVYYQNQPFTGKSIAYYQNGNLEESTTYKLGRKHGQRQKYFENGMISFQCNYLEGKQHGKAKTWWINGNLRSESYYEEGLGQGLQKQWYKSGVKFKFIHLVDGREEGLQKAWRENGKIYNNYEARNGRIYGLKRANLCYGLDNEKIQLAAD